MKVLLIWEEIPESIKLFSLEGELAEMAFKAHGCYVNMVDGDPNDYADNLSQALIDVKDLDQSKPIPFDSFDYVVLSGFLM